MRRKLDMAKPRLEMFVIAVALVLAFALPAIADCRDNGGDWQAGSRIFHNTCIACHGAHGHGIREGVPDLTAGVMAYSSSSLAEHIERGFKTQGRSLAMPPKGGNPDLTDEDIKNVLSYLRHTFGCG